MFFCAIATLSCTRLTFLRRLDTMHSSRTGRRSGIDVPKQLAYTRNAASKEQFSSCPALDAENAKSDSLTPINSPKSLTASKVRRASRAA